MTLRCAKNGASPQFERYASRNHKTYAHSQPFHSIAFFRIAWLHDHSAHRLHVRKRSASTSFVSVQGRRFKRLLLILGRWRFAARYRNLLLWRDGLPQLEVRDAQLRQRPYD